MAAPAGWRAFAAAWCGHGLAVAIGAAGIPASAAMLADPEQLEAMSALGLGAAIAPLRAAVAALRPWTPWLLALGAASLAAGGLACWRPRLARWPLHGAAAANAVVVTWATWELRAALPADAGTLVATVAGVLLLLATAALSSWYVERAHSTAAPAPD